MILAHSSALEVEEKEIVDIMTALTQSNERSRSTTRVRTKAKAKARTAARKRKSD